MKLSHIKREHILAAADKIDAVGIDIDKLYSNYWVVLPDKREYPFKEIIRVAHHFTEEKLDDLNFVSNESYRNYLQLALSFDLKYYQQGYNFFSDKDITHFQTIGGQSYRATSEDDSLSSKMLLPLVRKVNKWADLSLVDDLVYKRDNTWQWSGTFKTYLWIRINRKQASGKVFFVVGATSEGGLFYKIDCLRSNYLKVGALPNIKQQQIDGYLKLTTYHEVFIAREQLLKYDWFQLVEETKDFIRRFLPVLDELEDIANGQAPLNGRAINVLNLGTPPTRTKSYIKGRTRTFKGANIDWSKKLNESSTLGGLGEKLVLEHEKNKLKNANLIDKIELVTKVKDGEGYDILSYDEHGRKIFIEVKTTMKGIDEPFYMSLNEREFASASTECYYVYRLYNFDYVTNSACLFIVTGPELLEHYDFTATAFEVSLSESS